MIHIIYIYFILNAFFAGHAEGNDENRKLVLQLFLFGSIVCFWMIIEKLWKWFDKKSAIRALFLLTFTNYFKDATPLNISNLKEAYESKYRSRMEKRVIRRIDKKYKYGITNGKT